MTVVPHIDVSGYTKFIPLVDPSNFIGHAVKLLALGFICVMAFMSYEVANPTAKRRSLAKEFSIAGAASVLLGMGVLMAMLGAGLYV